MDGLMEKKTIVLLPGYDGDGQRTFAELKKYLMKRMNNKDKLIHGLDTFPR